MPCSSSGGTSAQTSETVTSDLRRGHANQADCEHDIRVRLLHRKHDSASWYIGAKQVFMDVFRVYVLIIDRQNNVALVKFARVVRWAPCGYRISAVKKWSLASSSKRNWEHSARTDEEVVDLAAIEHKPHLQTGQGQAGSA